MPQHYFCEWAKNRAAQPLFSNGFKKIITSKQNHDYYHKASVRIQSKKRTNFLRRRKICDRVTSDECASVGRQSAWIFYTNHGMVNQRLKKPGLLAALEILNIKVTTYLLGVW